MATKRIRYLIEKPAGPGRPPRYYWQPSDELRRLGWTNVRLPNDLAGAIAAAQQHNATLDAWRTGGKSDLAKSAAPPPRRERTLGDLIALYREQDYPRVSGRPGAARRLAAKTIVDYEIYLRLLDEWAGDVALAKIEPHHLRQFYEDRATKTPAKAAAVLRTAQALLKFGRLKGWLLVNPADRLGLAGSAPSGIVWPRQAVTEFVRVAELLERPSIGAAVQLNEWLGQREADLLRLPASLLAPGGVLVRQNKTRAGVRLPVAIVPILKATAEAELARHAVHDVVSPYLLLSEATGRPYGGDEFRHAFATVRAALAAEIPAFKIGWAPAGRDADPDGGFSLATTELQFMHLRHTAVTRLAEAKATHPMIAAITGHSLATIHQILSRYLVLTEDLVTAAFEQRMDAEAGR